MDLNDLKKIKQRFIKSDDKINRANGKVMKLIPHSTLQEAFYWVTILDSFPITKRGKVNLILRTDNESIIMGIATDHLKSVASIIGIPNTYIDIIISKQNTLRFIYKHQQAKIQAILQAKISDNYYKKIKGDLKEFTFLLLKATALKVLQTGEE